MRSARSVLVVEDERIVALDLQQTLIGLGYDAFAVAASGEEAIARAAQRCPDVVLIDIRIEGDADGIQTAEILKRQFGLPIIYLTAHADDATIERAKLTEPHGYLLKPVRTEELRSAIEVCLYKHEMENRLRERERWFSTTLESIGDAVVTVDLAGRVTFMNRPAEALTGVDASAARGRSVHEILRLSRSSALPDHETAIATALREERAVEQQEAKLLNIATGAQRLISDSAAPVIEDGETRGAVMVFRDVTEQRKLQSRVELTDRLASMGTMAAGVTHEVNNPLAVVVANGQYLADELKRQLSELAPAAPSNRRENLEDLVRAAEDLRAAAGRIRGIMTDLRAFTRPAHTAAHVVNVEQCIGWALRTTSHAFQHRARVSTELATVPAVQGDEGRLGQVLVNLLVNAAHAIAPGHEDKNRVTVRARSAGERWVVIEVQDTGCGIAADALPHIFDPFYTTKQPGEGTGLGLSICHGIVTSIGGELLVESWPGRGSLFSLRLPAAKAGPAVESVATPATRAASSRAQLMVVDDEPLVLRAIQRILRDHSVTALPTGHEALALIEGGARFDLIFSDVTMPTMTGVQFYETLLERDPALAARVVFMSGGALSPKADDFLRTVTNPRIEKPFDIGELLRLVQRLLTDLRAAS